MSEIEVTQVTDRAGTGEPDLSQGYKVSGTLSTVTGVVRTEGTTQPSNANNGDTFYHTVNNTYFIYANNVWKRLF